MQDEHIIQGEETNEFVDFDEFLTGVNARKFKTYDNSSIGDLIKMDNCTDSQEGYNKHSLGILGDHLDGKHVKKAIGRSSSRDSEQNQPFRLSHAFSKVSNLTEGNSSKNISNVNASRKPLASKQGNFKSTQSFIKNQIKALLDFHVQRQGLPLPGKKVLKK